MKSLKSQFPAPVSEYYSKSKKSKDTFEKQVRERALKIFKIQLTQEHPNRERWVESVVCRAREKIISKKISLNDDQTIDYEAALNVVNRDPRTSGASKSTQNALQGRWSPGIE